MIAEPHDAIALFDLDGTLADFDGAMAEQMELLRSDLERAAGLTEIPALSGGYTPKEPWWRSNAPWMGKRRKLIKSQPGFWRNLKPLKLGFDVLDVARKLGFENHALTKGPEWDPKAWSEKVEWCKEHVPDLHITIGQKKSLVYGKVLADDWPPYFLPWLEVRPRGLVIAVEQRWNRDIEHPRVVIYNGTNLAEVRERMAEARASVKRDRP